MNNSKSPDNKRIQPIEEAKSTFPPVDGPLVDALDLEFPDRMISPTDSDKEIWIKVGQVSVVRFLRDVHNNQQDRS